MELRIVTRRVYKSFCRFLGDLLKHLERLIFRLRMPGATWLNWPVMSSLSFYHGVSVFVFISVQSSWVAALWFLGTTHRVRNVCWDQSKRGNNRFEVVNVWPMVWDKWRYIPYRNVSSVYSRRPVKLWRKKLLLRVACYSLLFRRMIEQMITVEINS